MSYLLIDPPVSPLSPPSEIQRWIDDLLRMSQDPGFVDTPAEKQITAALRKAREWHTHALRCGAGVERHAGSQP